MQRVKLLSALGYLLILLLAILGVYVAYQSYCYYPSLSRGLVAVTAIYYSFRFHLSPKQDETLPSDLTFRFPEHVPLLLQAFVLEICLSWAGFQIVDMARWIIAILKP
jgi:hypothetical protein